MYALGAPKSEDVEKPFVLKVFLKGSKGARAFQECKNLLRMLFLVEKATKNEQKEEK